MELYIIEDYRDLFPDLRGKELTDALVLDLLRKHGHLPSHDDDPPRILRLPGGKPVLSVGGIHFSVSHSGHIFACAVAEENLGLDIQVSDSKDRTRLAQRYFTEEEYQYVSDNGPASFYRIWTRKEAYAKYTGEGLEAVINKTPVLDRPDLVFQDLVLDEGLYGCICTAAQTGE